ncbi:retropepsin-like domain-containing protein [Luteibacter aegosomatis]|uniref:retropepsin-like aspartic protease n=1 Tax=Luteibacter aegosomatis TaxID=2911537 RepID=UPI001FF95F37|nr:retropepsin-like aspartic protease [Luteibacter aegosomatis]UPG87937.1 retropepsin-like domain-containing protein [Luteibacter aegosomatis]
MVSKTWQIVGMLGMLVTSAQATTYVKPTDNGPLGEMIRSGNVEALRALRQRSTDELLGTYLDALIERARLHFDASSKLARQCYEKALPIPSALSMAAACAELAAGNLFVQGEHTRRESFAHEASQALYPRLNEQLKRSDIAIHSLEPMSQALPGPLPRVVRKASDAIAWVHDPGNEGRGLFVKIGGEGTSEATLLFDTGTQRTVLTPADARSLGATRRRPASVVVTDSQGGSPIIKGDMAVLPVLHLAGARLDNVDIFIADVPRSVLGLDVVLRSYDGLRMDAEGIAPLPKNMWPNACPNSALYLAGPADGAGIGLVTDVVVDGQTGRALLDTGNSDMLDARDLSLRSGGPGVETTSVATLTGRQDVVFQWKPATLGVAGGSIEARQRMIAVDPRLAPRILGAGIVSQLAVLLDFRNDTSCLLRAER